MPDSFDYRSYRLLSCIDADTSRRLVDAVVDGEVIQEHVFRDNWRTLSAKLDFEGRSLLLKVPRARNMRSWERLLTRFRGSDAFRTFLHLETMASMGFRVPQPVLAAELRSKGVVVDSFMCYRFVEGRPAEVNDADKVLNALQALHQRGYLRSDAQLANFLMVENAVVFIDFRLKKPRFLPKLQKAREIDRFLRSCPESRSLLSPKEASSGWLWLASRLEDISFGMRNLKRRLRARRKSERRARSQR
jgi:heptose II phosphotransferase